MKLKLNYCSWPAIAAALAILTSVCPSGAQSTAFTYHGRLSFNGAPVNGPYEIRFALYDLEVGGNLVAGPLPPIAATVANGLFTVRIDFGAGVFIGPARWLNVEVRPAGGVFLALTPRQEVTSSPYAIRAETAATVASSSVAANQLNTGGIPPTPGQFLSYDGGHLVWSDPAVAGSNVWSLNGSNAYYNAGSVGIGTATPFSGNRLHVVGGTLFEPGGSGGGFIGFHTPNAETGITINGDGDKRADIRFDGSTLKLLAADSAGPPSSANGVAITTSGNVGIGTATPAAGIRLDVKGSTLLEPGGTGGGFIQFHTPDTETGMTISGSGTKRADIRFDGDTLKLLAADSAGPPSSANGIAITTGGNVGIGTTTPVAKLHAETSAANTAAVYGDAPAAGGVGVYGKSTVGTAIHAEGNATQSFNKGGFVKAMAYIDPFLPADQYVVRCYNSQQPSDAVSTRPCGITVERISVGQYRISFSFNVNNRFISMTTQANVVTDGVVVGQILFVNLSTVELQFFRIEDPPQPADSRFHIMVY